MLTEREKNGLIPLVRRTTKMRTHLDNAKSWFLEKLDYSDEIGVVVVEVIRGDSPEEFRVGEQVVRDAYPLEPRAGSRKFIVKFFRPVAWQVVDESYTSREGAEVRDDDCFLQVLSNSPYLDYVSKHHGWYVETVGPAKHYRLWTENNVIDVIAHDEPHVEPIKGV